MHFRRLSLAARSTPSDPQADVSVARQDLRAAARDGEEGARRGWRAVQTREGREDVERDARDGWERTKGRVEQKVRRPFSPFFPPRRNFVAQAHRSLCYRRRYSTRKSGTVTIRSTAYVAFLFSPSSCSDSFHVSFTIFVRQQRPTIFKSQLSQQQQQQEQVTVARSLSNRHRYEPSPEQERLHEQLEHDREIARRHHGFGFGIHGISKKQWQQNVRDDVSSPFLPFLSASPTDPASPQFHQEGALFQQAHHDVSPAFPGVFTQTDNPDPLLPPVFFLPSSLSSTSQCTAATLTTPPSLPLPPLLPSSKPTLSATLVAVEELATPSTKQ